MQPNPADFQPPPSYRAPGAFVNPPPPRSSNRGCLFGVGCLLVLSIGLNLILLAFFGSQDEKRRSSRVRETWISGQGEAKLALIQLSGVITEGEQNRTAPGAASNLLPLLRQAANDPAVKGLLIDANSPGGSVTASDKIYHAVESLRVTSKKPVVLLMGDTCASGCVYVAAAASEIVAHPTTVTGSIGVIISTLNFAKFFDNYGIKGVTIASQKNKALLSPFEPVQDEHKAILKTIVDEMYERFVDLVVKGRKIPRDKLLPLADGRIFTAKQALQAKLIDAIGYRADAVKRLLLLAKVKDARLVSYKREVNFFDIFQGYSELPAKLEAKASPSLSSLLELKTPKAWYLWQPLRP